MSKAKEKMIDKNILEANIKLVDENKHLKEVIKEVINDLELTKQMNTHFTDSQGNVFLNVDIDHIDYLLKMLGETVE